MPRKPDAIGPRASTAWEGEVAQWYDNLVGQRGSSVQEQVIFPKTLRLARISKGEFALDFACGQGAFCVALSKAGARVTGVDASAAMIQQAKRRFSKEAKFQVADARDVARLFPEPVFDAIFCILAIQNIDPMEPVFSVCARALYPGGRLVVVMNHPAFRIPRQSNWGWDEARKLVFRRVDRYVTPLKIPIQMRPGADPDLTTWSFHRPLEEYVKAISGAGLAVDAMEEWPSNKTSQVGSRARAENRAREEFPLFIAIRAVKTGTVLKIPNA